MVDIYFPEYISRVSVFLVETPGGKIKFFGGGVWQVKVEVGGRGEGTLVLGATNNLVGIHPAIM